MMANLANPVIIDGDTGCIDPHALHPQPLKRPPALRTPLPVYRAYRATRGLCHRLLGRTAGLAHGLTQDPFWVLVALRTAAVATALAVVAWIGYEIYLTLVMVGEWFAYYGRTIIAGVVCVLLLGLLGVGSAVKCAGLHCGGCKG